MSVIYLPQQLLDTPFSSWLKAHLKSEWTSSPEAPNEGEREDPTLNITTAEISTFWESLTGLQELPVSNKIQLSIHPEWRNDEQFIIHCIGLESQEIDRLLSIAEFLREHSPIAFKIVCTHYPSELKGALASPEHTETARLIQVLPQGSADEYLQIAQQSNLTVNLGCATPDQLWPAIRCGQTIIGKRPSKLTEEISNCIIEPESSLSAEEWGALIAVFISEPSLRSQVRSLLFEVCNKLESKLVEQLNNASGDNAPFELLNKNPDWVIDGPFDSSYSLAIVNREMGNAIQRQSIADITLSDPEHIHRPINKAFLHKVDQEDIELALHSKGIPDVMLRNNYPPLATNLYGKRNLFVNYAWEESGYPAERIAIFNATLDGMTVVSSLVRDIMRNNGLSIPVAITGNGVDHLNTDLESDKQDDRPFTYLHISSCFPRKGVSCLLDAWGQAFRASDNVKLIIKTFDNPHNDIREQLSRKQVDKDYPEVELICRDMETDEINALYAQSDAFVAPSKAEGFGMPMAEAMLFNLPVIVTGHGGQKDFCTAETAWLVDYKFSYSDSHLGLFDSAWVEPDPASLKEQLLAVLQASPEERQQRCNLARNKVLEAYTWDQIAQQTGRFVEYIEQNNTPIDTPDIIWVSTYNSSCGIATYSESLLTDFPKNKVHILADKNSKPNGAEPENLKRCLSWGDSTDKQILSEVDQIKPKAVVVQHNHAFMPLEALGRLAQQLHDRGVLCLITMHNTHVPDGQAGFTHPGFKQASRILVHNVDDLNRLKKAGLVDNVALFPHGVYPSLPNTDQKLRNELGLDEKRVIASFGFLMPHKGVKELIRAFAKLYKENSNLHLLLCNAQYPDDKSAREVQDCRNLIHELGLEDAVTREHRFLSDQETINLLSLADLIIFPYQYTQESASGAVRMGIAASAPILVTPLPIFQDVEPAVHFLPGMDPESIAKGINKTLKSIDEDGLEELMSKAESWKEQHQWPLLSKRLLGMIKGLHLDLSMEKSGL